MDRVTSRADLTYHTSLTGTLNVLRFSHPVPIVVFSSSAVYGLTTAGTEAREADASRDRALDYDGKHRGYASGKWQMERLAESAARSGRSVLTIRPFNVVGPGQSGDGGMVIPRLVKRALSGEPLTIYGDGSQGRCFGEVSTFVNCILRLCDSPGAWPHGGGCFNVGTQTSTSILELARIVVEETASNSRVEHRAYQSIFPHKTDVAQRVPDVWHLTNAIGTTAWPRLRDIVRQYVASVEHEYVPVGVRR
jgi:UDP-glucose 4-epimerase